MYKVTDIAQLSVICWYEALAMASFLMCHHISMMSFHMALCSRQQYIIVVCYAGMVDCLHVT